MHKVIRRSWHPADLVVLIVLGGASLASAFGLAAGERTSLYILPGRLLFLALAAIGAARSRGRSALPGWALALTAPLGGAERSSALVALAYLVLGLALVESRRGAPALSGRRRPLCLALGILALGAPFLARGAAPALAAEAATAILAFALIQAVCRKRGLGQLVRAELPVLDLTRAGLSPRQREVLDLHRQQLSVKEIAARLSLSDSSVRKLLSEVYHKLKVGNAAGLAALTTSYRLEEGLKEMDADEEEA